MSTNKNTIKLYWQQVRKHKVSFFVAMSFIPVSALLLDTLLPYFLAQSIGALTSEQTDLLRHNLIIASIVGIAGVVTNFIGFRTLISHEGRIRTHLYNATFQTLLRKDQHFFVNEKVGALTSRFIDFVRAHVALQDLFILRTLSFCVSLIVGLGLVAMSSLPLAGILLLLILSILVEIRIFTKIRKPYRMERKTLVGEIHGEVADSLTNNLLVKTFAHEDSEITHLEKQTHRLQDIFIKDIGIFAIDGSVRNGIMVVTQIVGIAACSYLVLHGQMTLAIAIFAIAYLQRVASQIFMLGEIVNGYDEALLQAAPMSDILVKENIVNDRPVTTPLRIDSPVIQLDNMSYHYSDSDTMVLRDITLTIPAGQKIGLVGHSGAGKTTIVQLLLRFADVSAGAIKIAGQDIRDVSQQSLANTSPMYPRNRCCFTAAYATT